MASTDIRSEAQFHDLMNGSRQPRISFLGVLTLNCEHSLVVIEDPILHTIQGVLLLNK